MFGGKKVIGLDVGTTTIKVAEMNVSRSRAELVGFSMAPTPAGTMNNGDIVSAEPIGMAIATLLKELRTSNRRACIGMWGTSIVVKKITIPAIEKKLIADQIRWEAEQYIPFDVNNISLTYHVIESKTPGNQTIDVVLVAAQLNVIGQYMQVVQTAGLSMDILDVSGFALANAFEINYGVRKSETVAILNVGATNTNFVVLHNGDVVFSRDMPVGGANYTQEIQKEMSITATEAESLKLAYTAKTEVPEQVQNTILAANEAMTEEIRNGFDFFTASVSGVTVSKCFITGGGSVVPGLVSKISEMINISVEPLNAFARVGAKKIPSSYLKQINLFAPVAMGLAMRKVGDS